MRRYRCIFHELITSISSKTLKANIVDIFESVASALYEISYLKADEYMRATARYAKENQNKSRFKLPTQQGRSKGCSRAKKKEDKPVIFISSEDRQKAACLVQSTSRCLRVPWLICGDTLNSMKRRETRKRNTMNAAGKKSDHEVTDIVRQLLC
jgi:hypothetical protein